MKKLSKITESIWSDIQDRSSGDTIRKEDKFNPNYVDFGDDTTVYWAIDNLEIDGEGKFYFDDIKDYNNNGWRLPTVDEVNQLKWNIWISWNKGCNHLKFDDGNELKLKTNGSGGFHMWTKEINTKFPNTAYAYGFDNSHNFDITSFNKSINRLFVFLVKDKKITESIWSDIQDRSAGDSVREEDKITTNKELRYKICDLYKKQGKGDTLDVSSLTNCIKCDDFSYIFRGFDKVKHIIGLEDWDVSNVRNMKGMFVGCDKFNSDLSKWNVSSAGDMKEMFKFCSNFNSDLSNWDVSHVKDMGNMFYNCNNFNSDLSKWDVSNVKSMICMFTGCENFNSDLSKWDVSKVTNMELMFSHCDTFNSDLSKWNVSKVESMKNMFSYCENFNSDLSKWDVSSVKDIKFMFWGCKNFNSDLSKWDVSNVENMTGMFYDCEKFNSDLSNWNVSNGIDMALMFDGCKSLKQIPSWYK